MNGCIEAVAQCSELVQAGASSLAQFVNDRGRVESGEALLNATRIPIATSVRHAFAKAVNSVLMLTSQTL